MLHGMTTSLSRTKEQLQEKRAWNHLYKEKYRYLSIDPPYNLALIHLFRVKKLGLINTFISSSSKHTGSQSATCNSNSNALHTKDHHSNSNSDHVHTMTKGLLNNDKDEEDIEVVPTSSADVYHNTSIPLHEYDGFNNGTVYKEEQYHSEGFIGIYEDEDSASANEQHHQCDQPGECYESIDEMDIFGEWFDKGNGHRPYETATLECYHNSEGDEEDTLDVSTVTQGDASPMTNGSSTSSLPHLPPLSLTPATLSTSNCYKDLVNRVLGVQISINAEMVTWMSGHKIILPYLENSSQSHTRNVL